MHFRHRQTDGHFVA